MSEVLPARPRLNWLKNRAKDRLDELRRSDPAAKLAVAQLAVAWDYGFPSWRSLKDAVDSRSFQTALDDGDAESMSALLADDPSLALTTETTWVHPSGTRIPMPVLVTAACLRKDLEMVKSVVAAGVDVNRPAVYVDGRPDIMAFLLDHGMDVDAITFPEHCTGLMYAAYVDGVENATLLLSRNADPNIALRNCGTRALHWLAWRGETKDPARTAVISRLLINAGADVNARIHSGLDDEPITDDGNLYLVEHGGSTLLHSAAEKNMLALARLLLVAGADPNARTLTRLIAKHHASEAKRWTYERVDGRTPIDLAAAAGHAEMVGLLKAHG